MSILTYDEFLATARPVADLDSEVGADFGGDGPTPGIVFFGGLHIQQETDGTYRLMLYRDASIATRWQALAPELYHFAKEEGFLGLPDEPEDLEPEAREGSPQDPRTWRDLNTTQLRALLQHNDRNADLDDASREDLFWLAGYWQAQQEAEGEDGEFLDKMMNGTWAESSRTVPAMLAALALE